MLHIYSAASLSLQEKNDTPDAKQIDFQKFYNMFSLAAELETYRLSSYDGKLVGNRESNVLLVSHMRTFSQLDNSSIAYGTLFGSGTNPSSCEVLSSADAVKAFKKIMATLATSPTKQSDH